MSALLTNNAVAVLNAGISNSATSVTLNSGQGALFPNPGVGEYFYATLVDASYNVEIVKCTARSTDTLTIVRGQDGTTARAYIAGDRLELRPVAEHFREKADKGANTDITSLTGITGAISSADSLQFDTTAGVTPGVGQVAWDSSQGTLAVGLLGGNVISLVGQSLIAYVTNAEASTITKGQAVYLYQATGDRASVKLAYNTGDATSAKTLGLVAEDIAAGQAGFVICQGVCYKLNTSAYSPGDSLYLGSTAGSLTTTKPYAPNHLVYIGTVEKANAGNGEVYVRVQNGFELDELHNVSAQSPSNGQTIIWNNTTQLWEKGNLTAGTGIGITNGAGSITVSNGGVVTFSGGTTGLTPSSATSGAVTLGGTLAVANGGTGGTTASSARVNLLPTYTGNGGKVLAVNTGGTDVEFISVGGTGTVTSVAASVPTGFSISGSPITSAGTLDITFSAGYSLPTTSSQGNWDTAYGWGNHATAGYALNSNIGVTIQGYDADLNAIAALSGTSGFLKKTAANTWSLDTNTYLTSYTETDPIYVASSWYSTTNNSTNWNTAYSERQQWDGGATNLVASTGRTSLGLGTIATQNSNNVSITGGAIAVTADPANALDVATKQYVDAAVTNLHVHDAVAAATTAALSGTVTYNNGTSGVGATLTLGTALTTLDGYTLQNGDRVLIKNQANAAHNGIYTWATGGTVLTRGTPSDTTLELNGGDFFFVVNGTINGDTGWVITQAITTIGTSDIIFTQFSGAGTYTAGTGLTLTGSQFSLTTPVAVSNGGTGTATSFTTGSVVFAGASGVYSQNNANFFWNNTNNRLGIGTTSPAYKLHLEDTTLATTQALVRNTAAGSTSGYAMGNDGAQVISSLYVSSSTRTLSGLFGPHSTYLGNGSGLIAIATESAYPLLFGTNSTEKMRIDSAGNVGIGTTSPNNYSGYTTLTVNGASSGPLFDFNVAGTRTVTIGAESTLATFGSMTNIPLRILTNATERMRITSAGDVGIGTTSPSVKLDVIGSIEASPAATQDGVILAGRAGGTSSYAVTLTPTTLTASRTITLPDSTTTMVGTDTTQTLTNKRITPRVSTTTSSATPTINTDTTDQFGLTALAVNITSFTTNLSGTPTDGQKLWIYIVGTAARTITWGASFEASTVALPTTTVSTNRLDVGFVWNAATSKWRCVAVA